MSGLILRLRSLRRFDSRSPSRAKVEGQAQGKQDKSPDPPCRGDATASRIAEERGLQGGGLSAGFMTPEDKTAVPASGQGRALPPFALLVLLPRSRGLAAPPTPSAPTSLVIP